MRLGLWAVGLFAVAVLVVLAARENAGYVLISYPPYRAEASLNLVVCMLVVGFIAFHLLLRLLSRLMRLPSAVAGYRARRRVDKARKAFLGGLRALFEGSHSRAEKAASEALANTDSPALAALVAARAAHEQQAWERRDGFLERAERGGDEDAFAVAITRAELLLDQQHHDEALAVLLRLPPKQRKHASALRLELKAQQLARNWDQALEAVTQLEKRGAIDAEHARQVRLRCAQEVLKREAVDADALAAAWKRIPASERDAPRVAYAAASYFSALGRCGTALEIIEHALDRNWDTDLVELYGVCTDPELGLRQIQRAESWLKSRPRDGRLLYTLGRLCARRELWGKAQSYLEASLSLEPRRETHLALARLFEQTDRAGEAVGHYRRSVESSARS